MKALLCKQYGPPDCLVVEDVDPPLPGAGEILVDVMAAAVNYPDLLIIENKYQIKPDLPFSPGSELAGRVVCCGDGVDGFSPGDRVVGLCLYGAYREQAVVDAGRCIPLPDFIDYQVASTLGLAYGTTIHALQDRAGLKPGETLLVTGASGGVGLAAVEIGKAMGARVIAAASDQNKLDLCLSHGADDTILYPADGLDRAAQRAFSAEIKSKTKGSGADVVYDPVGGDYAEPTIRALAWNGRYLVIGFAAGGIPSIPMNLPLLKGASLVGVFWGEFVHRRADDNRKNFSRLFEYIQSGAIKPHIDTVYALSDTPRALQKLAARKVRGKLVIDMTR